MIETTVPSAVRNQKKAPEALRQSLKEHLVSILEGPLTSRMLLELEQAASLAHKLLIVSGEPRVMRNHGRNNYGLNPGFGVQDVVGPEDLNESSGDLGGVVLGAGNGPLAPAAFGMGENFGAEAIRNIIGNFNAPKLRDLLDSLRTAEELRADNPDIQEYQDLVHLLRKQVEENTKHSVESDVGEGGSL